MRNKVLRPLKDATGSSRSNSDLNEISFPFILPCARPTRNYPLPFFHEKIKQNHLFFAIFFTAFK